MLASMGRALWNLKKFEDAKWCLGISFGILDKHKNYTHQDLAAATFIDIAELYEKIKEFKRAVSVLSRAQKSVDELPHKYLHLAGKWYTRIGSLTLYHDNVQRAIPYLQSGVEKLKEGVGLQSYEVGCAYNVLGAACMELGNLKAAVKVAEYAKDIIDVSLGPDNMFALGIWQNLSRVYADLGRYSEAIELLEKAIEGLRRNRPSAQERLYSVGVLLMRFKRRAKAT